MHCLRKVQRIIGLEELQPKASRRTEAIRKTNAWICRLNDGV